MSGFDNETVYCNNWDFRGVQPVSPQVSVSGQLPIGTGGSPAILVGRLVSPDSSITIGYVSPNITLQAANSFIWNDVSGAFSPLKTNGYFITGTATGTLPATPTQGDTIKFFVDHASQFLTIKASGTQLIRFGTLVSSAGGTAVSTQQGDSATLVYRSSNTCWECIEFVGTWVIS